MFFFLIRKCAVQQIKQHGFEECVILCGTIISQLLLMQSLMLMRLRLWYSSLKKKSEDEEKQNSAKHNYLVSSVTYLTHQHWQIYFYLFI